VQSLLWCSWLATAGPIYSLISCLGTKRSTSTVHDCSVARVASQQRAQNEVHGATLVSTLWITSALGALGAAELVYTTRKRASILHRLLFTLSIMDLITSLHFIAQPLMFPTYTRRWGLLVAQGSKGTCRAVNFIGAYSMTTGPVYVVGVALYFYLTISWQVMVQDKSLSDASVARLVHAQTEEPTTTATMSSSSGLNSQGTGSSKFATKDSSLFMAQPRNNTGMVSDSAEQLRKTDVASKNPPPSPRSQRRQVAVQSKRASLVMQYYYSSIAMLDIGDDQHKELEALYEIASSASLHTGSEEDDDFDLQSALAMIEEASKTGKSM